MKTLAQLLAATSLLALACDAEGPDDQDGDCSDGKCDDADGIDESPCDGIITDRSGRGLGTGKIAGQLGDALAVLAFGDGETCPSTFPAVVEKLLASGKCDGHRSMLVSERSQLEGKARDYRSVTFMECEVAKDKRGSVWFSAFGIQAESDLSKTTIPPNAEMFAFDPVAGVFNYYETKSEVDDEGKVVTEDIEFFGNSDEFVDLGASGQTRRCAGCHTGGGPIMKELNAPWLHWQPDFTTPGHSEIITANATLMGTESDGVDLEGIVSQGNDEWNEKRIDFEQNRLDGKATVADLLRPVFCTVEVNVDSEFGKTVSSGNLGEVVVDTTISGFGSVSMSNTEYTAILKEFGSRMAVTTKKDTIGAFTRITRGEADTNYQQKLIDEKIVTQEFVEDVLLVDFTRSVFSTDRCALLEFAPALSKKDAKATKIRDGFIKKLEAEGDSLSAPAADFLRNLKQDKDDARATTGKFETTCGAREGKVKAGGKDVSAGALDYMIYALNVREQAMKLPVFEFDGLSTPLTNVGRPTSTRLHPETCELTTKYVSTEPVIEGQPEEPEEPAAGSCEGRCNEFTDGATCQCDAGCAMFNNCCADKAMVCGE